MSTYLLLSFESFAGRCCEKKMRNCKAEYRTEDTQNSTPKSKIKDPSYIVITLVSDDVSPLTSSTDDVSLFTSSITR